MDLELQSTLFQMRISRLSEYKLLADLCMNVAYSFNVQMGDSWFASCGLASGLLAMQKIWLCSRQTESLANEESTSPTRRRVTRRKTRATTTMTTTRRRRSRRRTHGQLPAITPRSQISAHEQLKRVASFSFDKEEMERATDEFVNGYSEEEEEEEEADAEEEEAKHGGDSAADHDDVPSIRLKSNGTIYSPSSTMTAAELRRIMSSARIGSILELEQIARQEREDRNHRDGSMFSPGPNNFC
jgi:hypothetical protein